MKTLQTLAAIGIKSQAGNNPKVGSVCSIPHPEFGSTSLTTKVMLSSETMPDTWKFRTSETAWSFALWMPELTFYNYVSISKADVGWFSKLI